jgi:membrane protein YqaA with SNARE-associated domain
MSGNTRRLYSWALQRTESKRAPLWIGLLFFLELVLFIPLDAVLIFFCLQNRKRIFLYILITTIASTLSALCGYLLGHFLWDLLGSMIVPNLISPRSFQRFALHYHQHEHLAVFLGALLPFPLKVLSLSAGIFHLTITPFLFFVLLARTLRFSLIGIAMLFFGEKVKEFVDRHFHRLLLLLGAKTALAFAFFWTFS